MRRREFIAVLGGAAACPLAGRAQQPERMRRVGVLLGPSENDPFARAIITAFIQALGRLGWVEENNIRIDYRYAAGEPTLFKAYATELVGLSPDVIFAGTAPAIVALRGQTQKIPIVFAGVGDPVAQGFVQSLAHPGGNITGFSAPDAPIIGKRLQLLKEVAPRVIRVIGLFNPDITAPMLFSSDIRAAASSVGITVTLAPVHDVGAIEEVVAAFAREPDGGLISLPDISTTSHRDAIVAAATRHRLPLMGYARAGGLIDYSFNPVDVVAQAAFYIDRILRGANPADLPVQQPTRYSLIINLKTAKALGLTVPPGILDLADEVIE
jgi:putative tryptophan/tyrosine transport system substrate-binding protein